MAIVERYSPRARLPNWIHFQHQARYDWVKTFCPGKRVVDAACGCGFGAKTLALAGAAEVLAFDLSEEAVDETRELCRDLSQIRVRQGDVTALPLDDNSVDSYICFETIEHVADDAAVVDEAWRILKPGGQFYCSSPNRTVTNPGTSIADRPFNPHHRREYSQREFAELLRRRFATVELLGQTPFSAAWSRRLTSLSRLHPTLAVRCHQLRKLTGICWDRPHRHDPRQIDSLTEPEFLIAVCTKSV